MEENNMNVLLMEKLTRITELEIIKSKVLSAIFEQKTQKIIVQKIQSIKSNFENQANFYGQNLSEYTHEDAL